MEPNAGLKQALLAILNLSGYNAHCQTDKMATDRKARLKLLFELQQWVILIVLNCVLSATAFAQVTINIFDFDGTLVEDRQSRDGAFNPEFILYRNNTRLNLMQDPAMGPESIAVTHQELEKMKPYLAQGEGRPGAVGRSVKLANEMEVKPGEYYLRYPDSYRSFREGPPGENRLLEQFKRAEQVAEQTGKVLLGPGWSFFVELCKTVQGAESIVISTARGHNAEREWGELFEYMRKKKYIKEAPSWSRVFNMTRSEFDRYNGNGGGLGADPVNIPGRKSAHLRELLLELRRVALPEQQYGQPRPLHEIRYFENSQDNLFAIKAVVREVVLADATPTRVTLINVGLATEVREAKEYGLPEVAILEPGTAIFRSGRGEDFLLPGKDSIARSSVRFPVRTCEGLFRAVSL